jgi:hypothetical protein
MAMAQIWEEIVKLNGRTLYTLDRQKPFTTVSVTESNVVVRPRETGKERSIPRAGIEGAHRQLVAAGRLTLAEIEKGFAPLNPAYVASLLAEIPGVAVSTRPLQLWSAAHYTG